MFRFYENLLYLLQEENINLKTLSKRLNVSDTIFYDYKKGAYPTVDKAILIANYFNCTLNFLMGLDLEKNKYKFNKSSDTKKFIVRYQFLLKNKNLTHFALSKIIDISVSSLYDWKNGVLPRMQSIIEIAKYFDVSIDYLVGRSDDI